MLAMPYGITMVLGLLPSIALSPIVMFKVYMNMPLAESDKSQSFAKQNFAINH
jgi:hypothetical protein